MTDMRADAVLLRVEDLRTTVSTPTGPAAAVDRISFDIKRSETVGLVGESGSGKTLTGLSITRLLPPGAEVAAGAVRVGDVDLLGLTENRMRRFRGRRIGMIFQDPMTSLNPVMTIGSQVDEAARIHLGLSRRAARSRTLEFLTRVGIGDVHRRADAYPHQFSGGMRQRVMIALALVCEPDLVIADEPTTALDVTVQAQVLEMLAALSSELHTAILLITHDMGIAARMCDRVNVMYAGQLVEQAPTPALFATPEMPYTWGLLEAVPTFDHEPGRRLAAIGGTPPGLHARRGACRFAPRCSYVREICQNAEPELGQRGGNHLARCHGTEPGGWISE